MQVIAGATLTLANAEINGGFLSGPGAIATPGGPAFSTLFSGVTSQTRWRLSPTAPIRLLRSLTTARLTLSNQATTTLSGFNNANFGRLTANGATNVSEFSTIGQFTVNGAVANVGQSDLGFGGVSTINSGGKIDLR